MEAVDSYIPMPERVMDKPFIMPIEDIFSIQGRGTVVTGRIERGICKVGEEMEIVGFRDTRKTVVTGVEMFKKLLDEGRAGIGAAASDRPTWLQSFWSLNINLGIQGKLLPLLLAAVILLAFQLAGIFAALRAEFAQARWPAITNIISRSATSLGILLEFLKTLLHKNRPAAAPTYQFNTISATAAITLTELPVTNERKNKFVANLSDRDRFPSEDMQSDWPSVSVVIPVKKSQATIRATIESLLNQDYSGQVEILLVGDVNDPTWEPIRPYIDAGLVTIIETTIRSANRDANAKRAIGLQQAKGEYLALTDSDMALPKDWISTGIGYIARGWPCVAGPMRGATGAFWDDYADLVSVGSKTPRFISNHVVDAERFGLPGHKPPITANVFMTRDALDRAGDFDPNFIHSYEDYSWFWGACDAGVPILCTPDLQADHYHRQGWRRLINQYTRSGRGCGDFITKYPESPFSRNRVRQLIIIIVLCLGLLGLVATSAVATLWPAAPGLSWLSAPTAHWRIPLALLTPAALLSVCLLGLLGLGIANAIKARRAHALIFPFITFVFGVAFTYGMVSQLLTKFFARERSERTSKIISTCLFLVILLLAAGLRLWNIGTNPGTEWDEPVYTNIAAHVANFGIVEYKAPLGHGLLYLSHPPFYFLLLGNWFRVVGIGITQARIFSVLMSLLTITVLFLYLRERMGRWALLPTLIVAADGWLVFANRISWIDNSVIFFGILGMWAYYRALRSNKPSAFILAGCALGFTLIFKQLGVYFCAVPLMNWLLSRQQTRNHKFLFGTTALCAAVYVAAMSVIYKGTYISQTLSQIFRSTGAVTSRGNVDSIQQIISALLGQYSVFAFSIFLCVVSLVWLAVDIIRSVRQRDGTWLHRYSLEASWIIASLVVFAAIQIKFPNYFIYLMIPLFIYLGMRGADTARSGWRRNHPTPG